MTIPTPPPAFAWTTEVWGAALRCQPLAAIAEHAFTTRQLELRGGPEAQPTEWAAAAALVGVTLDRVARVRQVHGRAVRVLRADAASAHAAGDRPDADAIVSNVPGLALAVLVADCVPILLADRERAVAAAVHAGWRGTCARVVRAAVTAMVREMGSRADHLIAAIGPSIRPCCYEVGAELTDAFRAEGHADADIDRWFSRVPATNGASSLRLNVARANRDQLLAEGVNEASIHDCGFCTQTYHDTFDSYRADGARAGRMAAMIVVPE